MRSPYPQSNHTPPKTMKNNTIKNQIHEQFTRLGINPKSHLGKMAAEILVALAQFEQEQRINQAA